MKKAYALFFVALFSANLAHAEDIDLFILAGQSNAQGWVGSASYYPDDSQGLDTTIRFYWSAPGLSSSKGQWTTLQVQGETPLNYFGPEVAFARHLKTAGYNPAIFKYSRGSTSIAQYWGKPGDRKMYDQMKYEFQQALSLLKKEGHRVRIRSLIWIQGESDAETPEMANAYQSRLKRLIDDFRHNIARNPRLAVILGVDEQHHQVTRNPQVVHAQQALAKGNRQIVFTSMMHLEKANGHLTPKGLEGHGRRIFEAYRGVSR